MSAMVTVVLAGERSGYVVASLERASPYVMGERLVVGDVSRASPDGEPEEWKAWLWPLAGGDLRVTQSCDAVTAGSVKALGARLQERGDKRGPWWLVPDGRCTAVAVQDHERWRCEIAAVVAHLRHRNADVEWMGEEDCERSLGCPDGEGAA